MGFNKRYVDQNSTFDALKRNDLKNYYGKSDMLIFDDNISSIVYNLYQEGKPEKEILSIIKQNMEEKNNEVY